MLTRKKGWIVSILTIFIACLMLGCSSCDINQDDTPSQLEGNIRYTEFTVRCDYGQYKKDELTILLNDSNLFFNPDEYFIDLIAGDVIKVGYTGEMYLQETYPSTVVIQDGEVKSVVKIAAQVVELEYTKDGLFAKSGRPLAKEQPQYVISSDNSYQSLSNTYENKTLYGTYPTRFCDEGVDANMSATINLSAIYDYDPRFPVQANQVFPWIDELEQSDILSVKKEYSDNGLEGGEFISIIESTSQSDIEQVFSFLQTLGFKKLLENEPTRDEVRTTLTIRTDKGTYTVVRSGGDYIGNGVGYVANKDIPDLTAGETYYRFSTKATTNTLNVYGEQIRTYENIEDIIGKLVFKETQMVSDKVKKYVLYSDFYWLYLFDETHFWLEEGENKDRLFEIVGETDFSKIFQAYPIEK